MPRKKATVPTPKHVTPYAKAVRATKRRKGKKLRVVAGTAAARALGIK